MEMDGEREAPKRRKGSDAVFGRRGHSADLGTFWGQKGLTNKKIRILSESELVENQRKCSKEDSNLHRLPY